MYFLQHWVIDWDKVKNQDDLIVILKSLDLRFERPTEDLEKLCKFVNKSDGKEVILVNHKKNEREPNTSQEN